MTLPVQPTPGDRYVDSSTGVAYVLTEDGWVLEQPTLPPEPGESAPAPTEPP